MGEQVRIGKERSSLHVYGDFALFEDERPSTRGQRERKIVGDHQLGLGKRGEKIRQLVTPKRIDPRCGFVEHENFRIHRKHRRHGSPASLTPAQVVRCLLRKPGGADVIEGLVDPTSDLDIVKTQVCGPEGDVVADPVHEELVIRILEDEAYPPSDLGERVIVQNEATDHDFAPLRAEQPVEMQRQRRLSRAIGAEQRHPFAGFDRDVEAIEDRVVFARVREGKVFDDNRSAHVSPTIVRPTTEASDGTAASNQSFRVVLASLKVGIVPLKPRAAMALWTRSPRS